MPDIKSRLLASSAVAMLRHAPDPPSKSASPAAALDRLLPPSPDPQPRALVIVPSFICMTSCACGRLLCLLLEHMPWPTLGCQLVAEALGAIFLIDLISGVLHAALDYSDTGERLRHVIPASKAEVHHTRESNAYRRSSAWSQAVWNFQAHHFAPFPEHDNQWVETASIATPLLVATLVQHALGWLSPSAARLWVMSLALGHGVQASHFLAHKRVHLGAGALPRAVVLLQDIGILLHPRIHRVHHETFDTNFCIFNGWANPLVNVGFRLAQQLGAADGRVALHPRPQPARVQ